MHFAQVFYLSSPQLGGGLSGFTTLFTPNGQRLLEISTVATDPECTTVLESSSDSCSLRVKFGDGEETSFPMEWLEKQVKHAGISSSDGSARSDDANAKVAHL